MKRSLLNLTLFAAIIIANAFSASAQTITSFTPATGNAGTLVTITGTGLSNPTSFTIGGTSAIVVSNTGTTLVAMVMPGATTGVISITAGGTASSSSNFTVSPALYPNTAQGGKLTGTGGIGSGYQGWSVALSADGNTAAVGAKADNNDAGAVYIYIRSAGTWTQQGLKLIGTGAVNGVGGAYQGYSVAISADGNTVIVGGNQDNTGVGAAWLFTRSGTTWTQQGSKLVASDAVGAAHEGSAVAISADGNTAIVSGSADNSGAGAVWIYIRNAGVWSQLGNKLVGTGSSGNAGQGYSVAISADGNTAMVGGYADNSNAGAVWVYTYSAGTWTQQGNKITSTGAAGKAQFGYSVALSADGNTAAVGGNKDSTNTGAVWIFTRSAGTWSQQGNKLLSAAGYVMGSALQGSSVAISADGNTLIEGGIGDSSFTGAAWVFNRTGTTWVQSGGKLVGAGVVSTSFQGCSIALSADGTAAMIGGYGEYGNQGAAWPFYAVPTTIYSFSPAQGPIGTLVTISGADLDNATAITIAGATPIIITNTGSTVTAMLVSGATTGPVSITTKVGTATSTSNFTVTKDVYPVAQQGTKSAFDGPMAISADGNTAVVGDPFDNSEVGDVSIYTRSGGIWTQQGPKLVGTGSIYETLQGNSVAISADGNTVIEGGPGDGTFSTGFIGAAWVFTRSGTTWTQQGSKLVGTGSTSNPSYNQNVYEGTTVGLSADGNTAIVGGPSDSANKGAAWIFTRSGTTWRQQGSKLVGTGAVVNELHLPDSLVQQAYAVAISADGNTVMLGAPYDYYLNVVANAYYRTGSAWVFTRTDTTWTQQGPKLIDSLAPDFALVGSSVALSADGNRAIIGEPEDSVLPGLGAACIFNRSGGVWTSGPRLIGTGSVGSTAYQGCSVALSADGNTAIVGGYGDNGNAGATWVYTYSGGVWSQQGSKLVGTGAVGAAEQGGYTKSPEGIYGTTVQYGCVVLSADGTTALIGAGNEGAVWTFASNPPSVTSFTPAYGPVGTLVTITGSNLSAYTLFTIGGVTPVTISNTGTTLVCMIMPGTVTGPISFTGNDGPDFSTTSNFKVTSTLYPGAQQGSKLVATGAVGKAEQTYAVAISADGNTAIVGGPTDNSDAGAAWIYTRSGTTWAQQGSKLVGTGAVNGTTGAYQGCAVAISADGNTAMVGGYKDNTNAGAAWVYTRSGTTWTQQGSKLVGTGAIGAAEQGVSVALSADGNTAMVGGDSDNTFGGAAWAYARSAGVWTQKSTKLTGTLETGAGRFGNSVAISADGKSAIIGGYLDNTSKGAAWVFDNNTLAWTQISSKLVGTGAIGGIPAEQGVSVAINADGTSMAVGGQGDNSDRGAVWIYTRPSSTSSAFTQQGSKLVGTGGSGAQQQGSSVGLSADGNTLVIGGYSDVGSLGAAWVFTRSGTTWTQQGSKLVGTGYVSTSRQGYSLALSADGNTAMVGGYYDNTQTGAAWVYVVPPPTITTQPSTTVQRVCPNSSAPVSVTVSSVTGDSLTYTWYSNWVSSNTGGVFAGVTAINTYTPSTVIPIASYYYCIVSGIGGSVTSNVSGAIAVDTPPIIFSQPIPYPQHGCPGFTPTSFSIDAFSATGITYLWYSNTVNSNIGGTPIPTATLNTYTPLTTTAGELYYYCVKSGTCPSPAISNVSGAIDVDTVPTILSQPGTSTQAGCPGYTPAVSIAAQATGISYLWYSNTTNSNSGGTSIGTATSNTYTPPTSTSGATYYYCKVSGTCPSPAISNVSGAVNVDTIPSITAQPSTSVQIGCPGYTPAVSLTAKGTGLNYLWYSNTANSNSGGTSIGTATSISYTPLTTAAGQEYYYCVVSGTCPSPLTSNVSGAVNVDTIPGITAQPSTSVQNGCPGFTSNALSLTAQGTGLSYLWYSNTANSNSGGTSIATATTNSYTPVTTASGEQYYYCIVSGTCPSPASSNVSGAVDVDTIPSITAQPSTSIQNGCPGFTSNAFSLTAQGTGLNYLWYSNTANSNSGGTSIGTATTNSYTPVTTASGGLYYYCNVSGTCPSPVNSNVSGMVDVDTIPSITTQPSTTDQNICVGVASNALSVTATGTGLTYLWYSNATNSNSGGTSIGTATSNDFIPVSTAGSLYYYCMVSGTCPSPLTSNTSGDVTVLSPSTSSLTQTSCNSYTLNSTTYTNTGVFTQHISNKAGCDSAITLNLTINKADVAVSQNSNVLTAAASGATYQWLNCATGFSMVTGATSQAFTAAANGHYAVSVTQAGCTDTSSCNDVTTTGINNIIATDADVTIYPMPNDGHFTITFNGMGYQSLIVYDEIGKQVYTRNLSNESTDNTITLDLSAYASGMYFARIITTNGVLNKKIVIQ